MDGIIQFTKIIGNNNYALTDKGHLIPILQTTEEAKEREEDIWIKLYNNQPKWYKKSWLKLVSKYNLQLPREYRNAIDYFEFKSNTLLAKTLDEHIVLLSKPIYHKELKSYRMIARFPDYFINANGDIYDNKRKAYLRPKATKSIYKKVSLRDQSGISVYASRTVHKLVGYTWVRNNDFDKKPILDHIDGNKKNCAASNLRWVSYGENANLAYDQNLKSNNIAMTVINTDTGVERNYSSIRKASKDLGISRGKLIYNRSILGKTVSGKTGDYVIKSIYQNDSSKDANTELNTNYNPMINTSVISICVNGCVKNYNNWREIKAKVLKVDPTFSYTIPMILKKIKRLYPTALVSYKKLQGVIGENITTGIKYETDNIDKMSKLTNIPKSTITTMIVTGKTCGVWKFCKRWINMNL